MEEKIKHVIIVRCNYTAAESRETAKDICNFSSKDLRDAVRKWMYTDEMVDIHEGRFTVSGLMKRHSFEYPAALVFIDWYRDSPKEAEESLRYMR